MTFEKDGAAKVGTVEGLMPVPEVERLKTSSWNAAACPPGGSVACRVSMMDFEILTVAD